MNTDGMSKVNSETELPDKNAARIFWIDGLKGIGCLCIVLHHFFFTYYPATYYGNAVESQMRWGLDAKLADIPFFFVLNGNFWVCVYLVISGFLMAYKKTEKPGENKVDFFARSMLKRYLTLVLPIFFAEMLLYIGTRVSQYVIPDCGYQLPFSEFIKSVFWKALFACDNTVIGALWTMQAIFLGGAIVLLVRLILKNKFMISAVLVILMILFRQQNNYWYFIPVFAGALIGIWYPLLKEKRFVPVSFLLLIAGMYLASYPTGVTPEGFFSVLPFGYQYAHLLGAIFCIYAIGTIGILQKIFSAGKLKWLAAISYFVYVFHIVIIKLTTGIYVLLENVTNSYFLKVVAVLIISLGIILIVADLYQKLIDERWRGFVKKISSHLVCSTPSDKESTVCITEKPKQNLISYILYVPASWLLASLCYFYIMQVAISESSEGILNTGILNKMYTDILFYQIFFVVLILYAMIRTFGYKIGDFVYRYRFALCLIAFVLCIAGEINGSSIGLWNQASYLGGEDQGLLLGASRLARSDEWFVSTPMAISQYYNPTGSFSYFSSVVRGTSTDVFLEYGQPVKSIVEIFRPFHWGYLFLSPGRGLAFFWCGRLIALFLVSFEMGMLISGKKKLLSLAYSMLMAFSPVVQWWFAVNGLVEMLIYAQLSVLMLNLYLETERKRLRAVYLAVIFICAGGFILTMYPAWMMPIAWIILGLIIWTVWTHWKQWTFSKADILLFAIESVIFIGLMAYVFMQSKDTISALMNTVYPGKRFETGGGQWRDLTNFVSEFWYPLTGQGTMVNASESSQFIDFFPLCYILPGILLIRDRVKDKLVLILLAVSVVLNIYTCIGVPAIIAKITLLSYATGHRVLQVAGFCNLMLLIRSMSLLKKDFHPVVRWILAALLTVFCVGQNQSVYQQFYASWQYVIITAAVCAVCFYVLLLSADVRKHGYIAMSVSLLAVCSGFLVNPVRSSVKNVTENEVVVEMKRIVDEDPNALWVVEGLGVPMTNVGLFAGAPTINSTNIYPNLELWEQLDDGENEDVYNRYAHILVNLKESGEASFELLSTDYMQVDLTVGELKSMGVSYIFTGKDLSSYPAGQGNQLELVGEAGNYRIYKIT